MDRLETRIDNIDHLQIIYLYSSMDRLETNWHNSIFETYKMIYIPVWID